MGSLNKFEKSIIEWVDDQSFGKETGEKVSSVVEPIAVALEGGQTLEQSLINVALMEAANIKTSSATLEIILTVLPTIADGLEGGKTLTQVLGEVLQSLLAQKTR